MHLIAYCREHASGDLGAASWPVISDTSWRWPSFRDALGRAGCAPRQMDQHGAILAGFWVLTADEVPDDREALNLVAAIREFVQDVREIAEQSAGRLVAEHLATFKLRKVETVAEFPVAELAVRAWYTARDVETGEPIDLADADHHREILHRNGIRAVRADEIEDHKHQRIPRGGPGDGLWLAYRAAPVLRIFEDTIWPGERWRHLLRGVAGVVLATGKVRIGSINTRAAIWIPRAVLLGEE